MEISNTKTAVDKVKGMAYKFDVKSIFINGHATVEKTIIRDPGTEKELALPAGTETYPINFGGETRTPEQITELIKTNPEIASLMSAVLDSISAAFAFEKK